MVHNIIWKKVKGHSHVLIPIEWGFEVHVLNVGSCESGTDDTVPHDLRRYHVGGACGKFERVLDKVPTNCDADRIRVFLLWTMVNDNASISYCPIFGNAENFCVVKIENCVSTFGDARTSLC